MCCWQLLRRALLRRVSFCTCSTNTSSWMKHKESRTMRVFSHKIWGNFTREIGYSWLEHLFRTIWRSFGHFWTFWCQLCLRARRTLTTFLSSMAMKRMIQSLNKRSLSRSIGFWSLLCSEDSKVMSKRTCRIKRRSTYLLVWPRSKNNFTKGL